MTNFRLGAYPSSSILYVYSTRDGIWFDPPYQRMGDVWSLEKRQLLIDSILNGFDLPKLYFHEFFPPKNLDGKRRSYAIVDGKQRLQSIFDFIDGEFCLADDFELFSAPELSLGGASYQGLASDHPDLKAKLDGFVLPIVTIQTDDVELIEDMFSRLNEAVPLNAAEKRNAISGPLAKSIRELARHEFFTERLPFDNKRYRHYDLATKFLFFQNQGKLRDTKKMYLDVFVEEFTGTRRAAHLRDACSRVLDAMSEVFEPADPLLRAQGMVVLYYFLFHEAVEKQWSLPSRARFERFETLRRTNRDIAESEFAKADYELLEFDRLAQSVNDAVALNYRYAVLRRYVGPASGRPPIPGA